MVTLDKILVPVCATYTKGAKPAALKFSVLVTVCAFTVLPTLLSSSSNKLENTSLSRFLRAIAEKIAFNAVANAIDEIVVLFIVVAVFVLFVAEKFLINGGV